jgi:CRISPR-associated protein Cmr3
MNQQPDKLIRIRPIDPVLIRDGRPFDMTPGETARTHKDILPGVLAGAIRTMLVKQTATSDSRSDIFAAEQSKLIRQMEVRGPFYVRDDQIFFPTPKDMYCWSHVDGVRLKALRPVPPNMPISEHGFLGTGNYSAYDEQLWPVDVPPYEKEWSRAPAYWSEERMLDWLLGRRIDQIEAELGQWEKLLQKWTEEEKTPLEKWTEAKRILPHYLAPFEVEERTSTAIDTQTGKAKEQKLFSTEMLVLPPDVSVIAALKVDQTIRLPDKLSAIHSMGGERRLSHFSDAGDFSILRGPGQVEQALRGKKYVRMVLATPAYFAKGWKPGWLNEQLETSEKWPYPVKLRLRWACIPGYLPVSGWRYTQKGEGLEKAVRRMVQAGSVYFFEVVDGDPAELVKNAWLASVSDVARRKGSFDHEDGFGLAMWGVWNPEDAISCGGAQ